MSNRQSRKNTKKNPILTTLIAIAAAAIIGLAGRYGLISTPDDTEQTVSTEEVQSLEEALASIPAYSGNAYIALNNNTPFFDAGDLTTEAFETYSDLDDLGRCGTAYANVCEEIMPTGDRGSIGSVKPTAWHTVKYDSVDGKYLYNRCHLIGYQLSGENANPKNLITGTRYLNIDGMLPFENMVADYVKETDNHVLYRVTPWFEGDNLLASGVVIEAESVEDQGGSILFNVYCYNVQPGIVIDYSDGSSYEGTSSSSDEAAGSDEVAGWESGTVSYIGSTSTKKFHLPDCPSVAKISDANRIAFTTREEAVNAGYEPCGRCKP